jgi:deoxyhypusine synthase
MARTERTHIRSREDISELPDWMKEKHCPHKKTYMAGKRIRPKNLTGKEKLTYIVDEVFLAYNSARLKEACQLFAERMLAPDVTIGMRSPLPRPRAFGVRASFRSSSRFLTDRSISESYHDLHYG